MLALSFGLGFGLDAYHTVSYEYYGLDYNKFTSAVDTSQVYEQGRHATGVGHYFILMPRQLTAIEFSVSAGTAIDVRTSNGVTVTLDISFQYRFLKEQVVPAFLLFGTNFETVIVKTSRDVIRNSASQFSSDDFITNRTLIASVLSVDVIANVGKTTLANIFGLQMRNVRLPSFLETLLNDIETTKQKTIQMEYDRNSKLYQAETDRLAALKKAEIAAIEATTASTASIVAAQATAQISLINAYASANASIIAARAAALTNDINVTNTASSAVTLATAYATVDTIKAAAAANATVLLAQASSTRSYLVNQGAAQGLSSVKSSLSFNATELLTFHWINNVAKEATNSSTILYNFQQPSSILKL